MQVCIHMFIRIHVHAVESHLQEEQKPMSKFKMRGLGLDKDHSI